MEQPMIEFRNRIIQDIEKYEIQGSVDSVDLLNEYLKLIEDVYEPMEQTFMVSCFIKGVRFNKKYREDKMDKTEKEKKLDIRKQNKLIKLWESMGLVSRGKEY